MNAWDLIERIDLLLSNNETDELNLKYSGLDLQLLRIIINKWSFSSFSHNLLFIIIIIIIVVRQNLQLAM
mgnify:CR=1 FL=1